MIKIKDKAQCYGCYACVNACPRECISMVEDQEGFRYPSVDTSKCTDCARCIDVCPEHADKKWLDAAFTPQAYAAYHLEDSVRELSASGGMFSALAEWTLQQGGVVFGVVSPSIDRAMHVKAQTIAEVEPMRNSKYIPSDVGVAFQQARRELQRGRQVLFSGTPCQIAGLRSFLGTSSHNLLTCDVLCHGIPSERVYRCYLAGEAKKYGSRVEKRFRSKQHGWKPSTFTLVLEDGRQVIEAFADSDYRSGYLQNLFQRPSCYACPFATILRPGDISLGDYFAYRGTHDNKGLSIVTVNTRKGLTAFEGIRERIHCTACNWDDAVRENEHLGRPPQYNYFRSAFFRRLDKQGYASAMRSYVRPNLWRRLGRRVRLASGCRRCSVTMEDHSRKPSLVMSAHA